MDTQKIKQLLTLIANKRKSQTDYGNTKKYIMEIIHPQKTASWKPKGYVRFSCNVG